MADIELVIKIPEELYKQQLGSDWSGNIWIHDAIVNGTLLPEGYGRLITETEILKFLKCPKYENCDWKNCFDCNESRCITLNNVNDLASVIDADKE